MDKKKAKLYQIISFLVILIIITLLLSTQNLVFKKITKTTSNTINVNSQEIYIADYEFLRFADWKFTSNVKITVIYMSDDDLYWFNSYIFVATMTFSERLDWFDDQIILDQKSKGSGFMDLLFKSGDYYLIFASFGSGELEYEVTYYSFYFDFQTVINIITFIIVAIGVIYIYISLLNQQIHPQKQDSKR
ncbi:MAG: hypothetical protein ACFE9R_08740 [Candidatus Hermodarchaeota archaeon]